ncbi:MAG: hypothetical protein H7A35_02275 [Planctomycetales bacterium]|nr:hypothetical protein [bacterium]UNM08886.1 MAG: hypothetical protein H7A35_02275 [Planctomycetales bacterium]
MSNETLLQWLLAAFSSLIPMTVATLLQVKHFRLRREFGFIRLLVLAQTAVCAIALFGVFIVWEGMDLANMPVGRYEAAALLILGQALFMSVATPTLLARMLHTRLWVNMGCGSIATLCQVAWLVLLSLIGRPGG